MPGAYGVVDQGSRPSVSPIAVSEKGTTGDIIEAENDRASWRDAWRSKLSAVLATPAASCDDSASRLSVLVKTGLLRFEDLMENPGRFFEAHRLLAQAGFQHGPGFSIRFTVQYNLFAGTILELGSARQLNQLREMQRTGRLGCFALTERLAGVNSGLVVHTTACWVCDDKDKAGGYFLLNTPHPGAKKNWISQGLTASLGVVVADLIVNGETVGPHAFLVPLRDKNNRPGKGVTLTDMGAKTTGNDLDNASIEFNSVRMDRTALLDKHCDVFTVREGKQGKGVYVERGGDASEGATSGTKKHRLTNMDRIGQRLFTGRIAVAQGAHEFRSLLFQRTKEATDNKPCWVPSAGKSDSTATPAARALSDVPQLKSLYLEETRRHERTGRFLRVVESALCASLLSKTRPDSVLVEAVAAAKVRAVDEAIEMTHRLRQEVGAYALMAKTGFEHTDFLQCCKFAEGDSRVLMMKMARDRVWRLAKMKTKGNTGGRGTLVDTSKREASATASLAAQIQDAAARGLTPTEAWDEASEAAYFLAEIAIEDIVTTWLDPVAKL